MSTPWFEPFLVVGTGRSGTSTVARILHEHFAVSMGDEFDPPDETNPKGFYEDAWFKGANIALMDGRLKPKGWRAQFEKLLLDRRPRGTPWGLKDPRVSELWKLLKPYVRFTRVIRCSRPQEAVIESFKRCYGHDDGSASKAWLRRELSMDALCEGKKVAVVDFSDQRSDEWIIEHLRTGPLGEDLEAAREAAAVSA